MILKEKVKFFYNAIDQKFSKQFGFRMKQTTFTKIVEYLHKPTDSSSLAVTRILFGLAMLFDIPDERGGATMNRRWGGDICHFPLFPFIRALPMPYMAVVYAMLWFGALGIMLGYKYRITSLMFIVCYWYLFLIEKSFWNNHSYLFGLVGLLLSCTQAHCFWSIDAYLDSGIAKKTVPYWNYFVLKYQFFILYFMAGMKKGTAEWLTGYSVQKLSEHWVFDPFKLFLTVPQIDYLIVHWFIFMFDLTIAVWMMWERTRHIAMIFCAMFHLMNSRLFRIGMFPWVCLATMPLFYPFDWPKTLPNNLKKLVQNIKAAIHRNRNYFQDWQPSIKNQKDYIDEDKNADFANFDGTFFEKELDNVKDVKKIQSVNASKVIYENNTTKDLEPLNSDNTQDENDVTDNETIVKTISKNATQILEGYDKKSKNITNVGLYEKFTTGFIIIYVIMQAFLPYSHFITKGYNNWTNGLYGYSWDMMVHTWDTQTVIVKIFDNENNKEFYIDPSVYTPNDRWTRHGDMVYQYAHCLNEKLLKERSKFTELGISENLSIYVDVWCSMNGRFTQRLFDSKADFLQVSWSPFEKLTYLMPLLDEAIHWRSALEDITENVHSWNNKSDVIFLADFPNYEQEKYIPEELSNVTLTVLEGVFIFETETGTSSKGKSYKLTSKNRIAVDSESFHKVQILGDSPAFYMYTFVNNTEILPSLKIKHKLPVLSELYVRFKGMVIFAGIVVKSLFKILFDCNGNCM